MPIPAPGGGWQGGILFLFKWSGLSSSKDEGTGTGLPFCSSGTRCVLAPLEFMLLGRKGGEDTDLHGPRIMPTETATSKDGLALRINETEDQGQG